MSFVIFSLGVAVCGMMAMYFSYYVLAMDGYPLRPDYLLGWFLFIIFEGIAAFVFFAVVRMWLCYKV